MVPSEQRCCIDATDTPAALRIWILASSTPIRECGYYLPLLVSGEIVRAAAAKHEVAATMLEPKTLACECCCVYACACVCVCA